MGDLSPGESTSPTAALEVRDRFAVGSPGGGVDRLDFFAAVLSWTSLGFNFGSVFTVVATSCD